MTRESEISTHRNDKASRADREGMALARLTKGEKATLIEMMAERDDNAYKDDSEVK